MQCNTDYIKVPLFLILLIIFPISPISLPYFTICLKFKEIILGMK